MKKVKTVGAVGLRKQCMKLGAEVRACALLHSGIDDTRGVGLATGGLEASWEWTRLGEQRSGRLNLASVCGAPGWS
jgi:hypothetical protein